MKRALAWPSRRLDAQDAHAYNRGWTITTGRFGSRIYRDPRWDHVEELRTEGLRNQPAADPQPALTEARGDARVVVR
ncbi:MAG: hypothetical protein ABS81_08705 [Pseudonocardia sp. SCN 72-86]|nr:MAG: hypothetical protein ABS81_08705 [Pseudonocardia sp. SCN 72-86]